MDALARFATALFASLAEAAPYLVVGYLLVALVREFVPPATLTRHLGGHGLRPLFNALGIGVLLPVCSCGSIPLGVGLYRSGAAVGTVLTLMTSSPAISPVAIAVGYSLLGLPLLMTLLAVVLAGSFLIGLVGNLWLHVVPTGSSPSGQNGDVCGEICVESADDRTAATGQGGQPSSTALRLRRAVRWAYWDLGADVSLDLLLGLAVAAAVIAFVPSEWVTTWLGQRSTWAMLCVILVSIPLYTCSVPAMLVMHSLLLTGAGPGSAVAFLVAGPASNLGELNAIRGSMGNRTAAYYSAALVVVALAGGMITDQFVFTNEPYAPPAADVGSTEQGARSTEQGAGNDEQQETPGSLLPAPSSRHVPAWHYPFMVVLAGVLALGIARRVGRLRRKRDTAPRVC